MLWFDLAPLYPEEWGVPQPALILVGVEEGEEDVDVDVGLPEPEPEPEPVFEPEEEPEFESSSFPVRATGMAMARTMAMMIKRMIPKLVRGLDRMRLKKDGLVVVAGPASRPALRSSSDRTWKVDILRYG
jgi:hypothetical protein